MNEKALPICLFDRLYKNKPHTQHSKKLEQLRRIHARQNISHQHHRHFSDWGPHTYIL
jgi:hypothetical protein